MGGGGGAFLPPAVCCQNFKQGPRRGGYSQGGDLHGAERIEDAMVTSSKEALLWPGPWLSQQKILLLNPGILTVMVAGMSVNLSMTDSFLGWGLVWCLRACVFLNSQPSEPCVFRFVHRP